MKRAPSKVGFFSKIAEIFSTALMAQLAQNQQKHKIHFSFYSTYLLGIYNFGHQVFLSCLDKFNGDLPLVYDLTLGPCYQSVAAAPPVAHFHRQLNLIRVANTQLITLNLISCIMHRKLVKPLLGFILHDKALNYATA